ncbi:MAG: SURF1 family cytochrome oxidase biogenesis protein, partial [Alphaproteobacteria bacterium]
MSGFLFRPLPGLTIAALVALAIAVGLGTWQLQRRAEKHAMLAQIEARQVMAAVAVEHLLP